MYEATPPRDDSPLEGVGVQTEKGGPNYYTRLSPQPIDVIRSWGLRFNAGCAVKYIARAGHKDPAKYREDLQKAINYLTHEIKWTKEHGNNGTK